jgi:hypothetical protein
MPIRKPSLPTAPRTVIAYHGCSLQAAEQILTANRFLPSARAYDWLGEGIYFWEYAPYRAMEWAITKCAREGGEPVVLRTDIRLGRCLNLLDIGKMKILSETYDALALTIGLENLPKNTERGAHYLDCMVIDYYCRSVEEEPARPIQTVRGSFPEGNPIYAGSKILSKAHMQIAVRDPTCILRISLVEFNGQP